MWQLLFIKYSNYVSIAHVTRITLYDTAKLLLYHVNINSVFAMYLQTFTPLTVTWGETKAKT